MKILRGIAVALTACLMARAGLGQDYEVGLIDSFRSGLPVQLWQDDNVDDAARLIRNTSIGSNRLINHLRLNLLLAQSRPKLSERASVTINSARLHYLRNAAALDQAEALLEQMPLSDSQIREQAEIAALLSGRPDWYCQQLIDLEFAEIETGMRIYCLMRTNNWQVAQSEFQNTAYAFAEDRRALLERFLDIEVAENDITNTPWKSLPTPIEFVLDEAIGRPRGPIALPLSYRYFLREVGSTPRRDLEVSEDLVISGAIPADVLLANYKADRSAESGGAWGRAEWVQKLDHLQLDDENSLGRWLDEAERRFSEKDLINVIAQYAGSYFKEIDPNKIENDKIRRNFLRFSVLGGWAKAEWKAFLPYNDPALSLALAIGTNAELVNGNFFSTAEARIAHAAFFGEIPEIGARNYQGDRLWQAYEKIENFFDYPEHEVSIALQLIRASGQDQAARNLAINMLLGGAQI